MVIPFLLFVVYLTTLSVTQDYTTLSDSISMNNKLERIWQEAAMA
jgi:hypothetical protein